MQTYKFNRVLTLASTPCLTFLFWNNSYILSWFLARKVQRKKELFAHYFLWFSRKIINFSFEFPTTKVQFYFTLLSKFFSTFLHSTCLLSVFDLYLELREIYLFIWTLISKNSTRNLKKFKIKIRVLHTTWLSHFLAFFSKKICQYISRI